MDRETGKYWDVGLGLVKGCSPVSPGCLHCWCASEANIRQHQNNSIIRAQHEGLTTKANGIPTFNGTVRMMWDRLDIPLKRKKPTVYSIWSDLFHEEVSSEFIRHACGEMWSRKRHTFLVLTKRVERMASFFTDEFTYLSPPDHIYHGTTVCNQSEADQKIPELLKVPGHKWLSIEPMLGEIDIRPYIFDIVCTACGWHGNDDQTNYDIIHDPYCEIACCPSCGSDFLMDATQEDDKIEWVVVGAETGPKRRPCKIEHIRSIVQQCQAAGVAVWVKSVEMLNSAIPQHETTRVYHDMSEWPEDLRVREVPWKF